MTSTQLPLFTSDPEILSLIDTAEVSDWQEEQPFASLQKAVRKMNDITGWSTAERTLAEDIVLITTEVGELGETLRDSKHPAPELWLGENGKPEGFPSELADIIIRAIDTANRRGIDLDAEVSRKMQYNITRTWRHGGKAM